MESLTVSEIAELEEGQDLDFKREINLDKSELKMRLLNDVVAFLNRGASRIIIGVEEKQGRFGSFRPITGDADKYALRLQAAIQDGITPVPIDVQVVPIHHGEGFLIDIRIPRHHGGPFVNRLNGSYLIRSGLRNLPIDPGKLRSHFIDELTWITRVDELTAAEDVKLASSGRVIFDQALRIGILPREHFDHMRIAFAGQASFRSIAPTFHGYADQRFKACEDGYEALSTNTSRQGFERLLIRDDWYVYAHIAYAIQQRHGEGALALPQFNKAVEDYLKALAEFFVEQDVEGPFAMTLALRSLSKTETFNEWFPNTSSVRTLRPRLVASVDDPVLIADFLQRVRRASVWG